MPYRGGPTVITVHAGGHPLLALLLLVLIVLLIVCAVVWLFRLSPRGARHALPAGLTPRDPAVESIRLRYARGEIGRDEFLRASADLGAPAPPL